MTASITVSGSIVDPNTGAGIPRTSVVLTPQVTGDRVVTSTGAQHGPVVCTVQPSGAWSGTIPQVTNVLWQVTVQSGVAGIPSMTVGTFDLVGKASGSPLAVNLDAIAPTDVRQVSASVVSQMTAQQDIRAVNWRDLPTWAQKTPPRSGRFDAGRSAYNVQPSNLSRYLAARTRVLAGTGTMHISIFGDSKSDTYNGNGPGGYDNQYSKWTFLFRKMLGLTTGGTGLCKLYQAGAYDPRLTLTGTWTNYNTGPYIYGHGGCTFTFDSAGNNDTGTVVEVVYLDYQTTTWTVSVDGATTGAGFVSVTNGNTGTTKKTLTISGLASGTHTVKVTVTDAVQDGFFEAVAVRQTTGLMVDNFAINGGATNMVRPTTPIGGLAKYYSPTPDLILVPLGINDLNPTPNGQGLTIAQTIANLQGLRGDYPDSDLILVAEEHNSAIADGTWDSYLGQLYDLADTLNVPLIDMAHRFVSHDAEFAAGLFYDSGVHQNAAGDVAWARTFAEVLNAPWLVGSSLDTGWRNISGLLINGWTANNAVIRRVGNQVTLLVNSLNGLSATNSVFLTTAPTGFAERTYFLAYAVYDPVSAKTYRILARPGSDVELSGFTSATSTDIYACVSWVASDAWPSSLPGVPA